MTLRVLMCVCAVLISVGNAQGQASIDPSAEKAIRLREELWERALQLGQQAIIDSIVAEDALLVGSNGELMTKAQADADRRKGVLKSSTTTQMIVRVFGNMAVVIGTNVEQSEYAGQDTSGQYRWTDVFEKRGGQWVVVSAHSTRIDDVPSTAVILPAEKPPVDARFGSLDGLSEDQVRARLGSPSLTQLDSRGVSTWYYDTPQGTVSVFFYRGRASLARPK